MGVLQHGVLTVPLDPSPEARGRTPMIDLQVVLRLKDESLEPLLHHCGGPGSWADCLLTVFAEPSSLVDYAGYTSWAISQRGIGPLANPSLECGAADMKPLPPRNLTNPKISDFTSCGCAFPDGTPLIGQSFAGVDPTNESQVRRVFNSLSQRSLKCQRLSKWQLLGPTGEEYHFLDWVGTAMLAHDIDAFREAICAPKMHLSGVSYGTMVASSYATIYPDSVGKVVLNGNMPVGVDTEKFAVTASGAMQQALVYVEYLCKTATHERNAVCADYYASGQDRSLQGVLVAMLSGLAAPTRDGTLFEVPVGLSGGYLQELLAGGGFTGDGWTAAFAFLGKVQAGGLMAQSAAIEVLDSYCHLPKVSKNARIWDDQSWLAVRTWYDYGVCIGPQQLGMSNWAGWCDYGVPSYLCGPGAEGFVNEAAVLGTDYPGRYSVSQAMATWRDVLERRGPLIAGSFAGIFADLFAWGPLATPCAIGHRQDLAPVVIGNLYDPATSYEWSVLMRDAFPKARMMTWQGVGHTAGAGGEYGNSGIEACLTRISAYWINGTLPQDGFVCRQKEAVPIRRRIEAQGELHA